MDESPGNKAADHLAVSRAIQMPESNVARMHVRDLQLRTDRLSKSLEGGLDSEEKISFIGYVKSSWSIVSDGCSREEGNNRISILTIKTMHIATTTTRKGVSDYRIEDMSREALMLAFRVLLIRGKNRGEFFSTLDMNGPV